MCVCIGVYKNLSVVDMFICTCVLCDLIRVGCFKLSFLSLNLFSYTFYSNSQHTHTVTHPHTVFILIKRKI